jgi:rhodanese-related sulfurtransferase
LEAAVPGLGAVSVSELVLELQNKDFVLINVHVPYAGEIPQTDADISYQDVPAIEAFLGANLDTKVVVYCMSNYMSGIAGNALVKDGYSSVRYLDGGLSAWKAAGQPVVYHDQ